MAQGMRIRGVEIDDTGAAVDGTNNIELYAVDQTTAAVATTSTDASGFWAFDHAVPGRFDVKITKGEDIVWIRARDEFQVTTIQARNPTAANAALHALSTTSEAQSLVATFGFRPSTESSGVETADEPSAGDRGYINYELSNDHADRQQWIAGRFEWEGVDVADGTEDSKLNWWTMVAGTLTEVLHLDGTSLHPETTDGVALGTSALNFSDLFLDSGSVINFDSDDVTLTHAANLLTLGGGDFHIDNGLAFVVGHTAQITGLFSQTPESQFLGTVAGHDGAIMIGLWETGTNGPRIQLVKSESGTIGTSVAVLNNSQVGAISWGVADGTDHASEGGRIEVVTEAIAAENDVPCKLVFGTTANNAASVTSRMEIKEDGGIFMSALLAAGASTDVNINGSNELHSVTSSRAFKENERALDVDSAKLLAIPVKTFDWASNSGSPGMKDFGLIAEDVAEVLPQLVNYHKERVRSIETDPVSGKPREVIKEDGAVKPYSLRTQAIIALTLDAVQKLATRIAILETP